MTEGQREWVFGRGADCDMALDDAAVSTRHCRLRREGDGFTLEDLGSTNGTFVNGKRVMAAVRVTSADHITLGPRLRLPWPAELVDDSQRVIRIGRAGDNDIVLDFPPVSAYHAIIRLSRGQIRLEDLGSTNGTAVGHPRQTVSSALLDPNDAVFFGSLRVPAQRLLAGQLALGENAGAIVAGSKFDLVFGRDASCDQVLNYPLISRRHARLRCTEKKWLLEDLQSNSGTFLNSRRVKAPTAVKPGDRIGLGSYVFRLTEDGSLERRDFRGNLTLEARRVSVDVSDRRLLERVSFTVFPGELVALMGSSGVGKSTLLSALNGYAPPSEGHVLVNGQDLYLHYDRFNAHIGYVPQDDIIHRELTVYQALYYTARLRLPADYSHRDLHERIAEVLYQLGLEGTEGVIIGTPEKKGISGGQRKRVNIAMELLTDPLLLFLDEPTSGLSSEDALSVMRLLRGMADAGKTILLTIHQPSLEAFKLTDNLAVLSRDARSGGAGMLAYYGPTYPESVTFFNPDGVPDARPGVEPSPDDVLRGYGRRSHAEWLRRYAASDFYRDYVQSRSDQQAGPREAPARRVPLQEFSLRQWATLCARNLAIKMKDRWNTFILLAQAPIVGLLVPAVYGKQLAQQPAAENFGQMSTSLAATIFLLVLAALWFGCSNAIREIVGEWAIYRRERMVNLSIAAYVFSKLAVLAGLCVVQCATLLALAHWGCNLHGSFAPMYSMLLTVSLVGVATGLTLSALAKSSEAAIAMLPIVLLPMVMLGGVMMPIHRMPSATQAIGAILPSRWGFEGLLLMENSQREPITIPLSPPSRDTAAQPPAGVSTDWAEEYFPAGERRRSVLQCRAALGAMFVTLLIATGVALRRRDVRLPM